MKRIINIKFFASLLCVLGIISGYAVSADAKSFVKLQKNLVIPVKTSRKLTLKGAKSKKVKWRSSDKKVASISKRGKLKAKSLGKTVITAEYRNKKYKCNVTVKTLLIAHRGYSGKYPENTTVAFEKAFEKGFDGIECDVWETNSGDLLISHDASLYRTTGKKKYIWNISKKSRKKYPIRYKENGKNKKTYIPTLRETAERAFLNNGYLFLHIKTYPKMGVDFSYRGIKKLMKILKYYELKSRTVIFKSGTDVIERFKNRGVKLGAYLEADSKREYKRLVKWCNNHSVGMLILGNIKSIRKLSKPKRIVKYARKKKTELGVYTVHNAKEYKLLSEAGAAFAMSNHYIR